MTLAELRTNRKIWRVRENSYYKKWYVARYRPSKKTTPAQHLARRKVWWDKYIISRDRRRWYDTQIAKKISHEHGEEISYHGVEFIAGFEGYSGSIYNDGTGVLTVGYGHTENVHQGAIWISGQQRPGYLTQPEAMRLLKQDLNQNYAPYVRALHLPLSQNAFDALTSFVYNVGPGGLEGEIGRLLKSYNFHAAGNAMLQWCHAGGQVLQGLLRRREAERHLLLS